MNIIFVLLLSFFWCVSSLPLGTAVHDGDSATLAPSPRQVSQVNGIRNEDTDRKAVIASDSDYDGDDYGEERTTYINRGISRIRPRVQTRISPTYAPIPPFSSFVQYQHQQQTQYRSSPTLYTGTSEQVNPNLQNYYIHDNPVHQVNLILQLREHFIKDSIRFQKIAAELKALREASKATNLNIQNVVTDVKDEFIRTNADMDRRFIRSRQDRAALNMNIEVLRSTVDQNKSQADQDTANAANERIRMENKSNQQGQQLFKMINTISQIVSNPVAAAISAAQLVKDISESQSDSSV